MTENHSAIVAVEALCFQIGSRTIIDNLSFSQAKGEHLLLLGPSGAGKTSLINLVTGLATPTSGRISIAGEPMSDLAGPKRDDLRRRTTGVVFQSLRLVSALSVRANLKLAQRLSGKPFDQNSIDLLIDMVGITHRADAKPRNLSQGEAQRAAIARALVSQPKLLIADEPTSSLDDANANKIGQLLINLASEYGSTLLIATHDARLKSMMPRTLDLVALGRGAP